jgi:cysteine desulfurase/selenocysteine lyase
MSEDGRYPFDLEHIRRDFPVLRREVAGDRPLVYLDNAATSQKPVQVIAELTRFYRDHNANVHRGVHTLSMESSELYEGVREKVRRLINAPSAEEIVFTKNTTESINLVAHAYARKFLQAGDEIVRSEIEHHSNIVPWQMVRDACDVVLKYIPMLPDGSLDLEAARSLIGPRTRLLAGAQLVPHHPVDVQALGADFLAFSAHKMLGPTGVGVLWGRGELLEAMDPFMGGGDMILTVEMDHSTWNTVPYKFEAGTPNIAGVVGFGAAIDYLQRYSLDQIRAHERDLVEYSLARLSDTPGVTVFGPDSADERGGVVSFDVEGVHPHDVGQVLDSEGVAIRAGHHCAQPVMAALQVPATVRASFYIYNTRQEIDALAVAVERAVDFFGGR